MPNDLTTGPLPGDRRRVESTAGAQMAKEQGLEPLAAMMEVAAKEPSHLEALGVLLRSWSFVVYAFLYFLFFFGGVGNKRRFVML